VNIKHKLLPYQDYILNDYLTPELCIAAGVGSGKTYFIPLWLIDRLLKAKRFVNHPKAWYCSHKNSVLRDPCWPMLKAFLDNSGIGYTYNKVEMVCTLDFGASIYMKSAEAYETWVGSSIVAAACDEPGRWKDEAYKELVERTRGEPLEGMVRQRLWTGTPQGLTAYMDKFSGEDFVSTGPLIDLPGWSGFEVLKEHVGFKKVLHYPTFLNHYIDLKDFIPKLLAEYGHDERLVQAHIYGQFVALNQNQVYEFSDKNLADCDPSPELGMLYLSLDFNVGKMAYTVWQDKGEASYCVAESPKRVIGTREACLAFMEQFPPHKYRSGGIVVYGDASGHNRSTSSDSSDYNIVKEMLASKYEDVALRVPKANKSVRSTIGCANKSFKENKYSGEPVRMYIDRRQKATIDSMYKTVYADNGRDIDKPRDDKITHRSDTVRYFASGRYPMKKVKASFGAY